MNLVGGVFGMEQQDGRLGEIPLFLPFFFSLSPFGFPQTHSTLGTPTTYLAFQNIHPRGCVYSLIPPFPTSKLSQQAAVHFGVGVWQGTSVCNDIWHWAGVQARENPEKVQLCITRQSLEDEWNGWADHLGSALGLPFPPLFFPWLWDDGWTDRTGWSVAALLACKLHDFGMCLYWSCGWTRTVAVLRLVSHVGFFYLAIFSFSVTQLFALIFDWRWLPT